MGDERDIYGFLKFGVILVIVCLIFSSVPLVILDKVTVAVFGNDTIYNYEHHNMLDWKLVKWIFNLLVGGYVLFFVGYLLKRLFTSIILEKEDFNPFHILGSVYSIGILWLGFSFVYGDNYGLSALIWSFLLRIIPFFVLKTARNLGF